MSQAKAEPRLVPMVLALCLAVVPFTVGCGSSSPTTPTPTGPTVTVIGTNSVSGIQSFPATGVQYFVPVTIGTAGSLNVTLDWTFAADTFVVGWGTGDCTANPNCPVLVTPALSTSKPFSVSTPTVQVGTYSFIVQNQGLNTESISYTVTLTH